MIQNPLPTAQVPPNIGVGELLAAEQECRDDHQQQERMSSARAAAPGRSFNHPRLIAR